MNIENLINELYNEEIKNREVFYEGIFKNKKKKEDEDDEWTDAKIKSSLEYLKNWINNPVNITYNNAYKIFTFGKILNLQSTIEKKMKSISDPKNECNWDDVVKDREYTENFIDDQDYSRLGLKNFPEAKNDKMLLFTFDDADDVFYMSKKSGKVIKYDYKDRYYIYTFNQLFNRFDSRELDFKEIDENKVKNIWKEIK